jgi:hypothetical protein
MASTDNVGVAAYSVELCQAFGCRNFAQIPTAASKMFYDTNLLPTATYRYRVRARDAVGNFSHYSEIASTSIPGHLLRERAEFVARRSDYLG